MSKDLSSSAIDPISLRKILVDYFSLDELNDLSFELDVDFDNLPGEAKLGKARELVIYCRNRGMLHSLIEKVQLARPKLYLDNESDATEIQSTDLAAPENQVYALVKAFNRNRHRPISLDRTQVGDDIAFQMREMAPELDGKLDVDAWLTSDSIGKRVAAVEFLDWKQDIDYFEPLLEQLFLDVPFVQFHILITLNSMLDQLSYSKMVILQNRLADYDHEGGTSRAMLLRRLQLQIDDWFRAANQEPRK